MLTILTHRTVFKINFPINSPEIWINDIKPIPANNPVVNRNVFVLSLSKYACVIPSKLVGNIMRKEAIMLMSKLLNMNNGNDIYPK